MKQHEGVSLQNKGVIEVKKNKKLKYVSNVLQNYQINTLKVNYVCRCENVAYRTVVNRSHGFVVAEILSRALIQRDLLIYTCSVDPGTKT